jgi:multisubunit Na+/H+ antiporter MnhE subunit
MNTVKQGDTHAITLTVKDATGAPVDLTTATAVRVLTRRGTLSPVITLPHTLGTETGTIVHQLTGTLEPGTYKLEVEVENGVVTTAPTDGFVMLIVNPSLG